MWLFSTFAPLFGCVLEETLGATVFEVGSEMLIAKHTLFFTLPPLFSRRLMETALGRAL